MNTIFGQFVANLPPTKDPYPGCFFDSQTVPRERLLTHWLIHSVLYYELDESVISDEEFDELTEMLRTYWEQIEHPHKKLIDVEALMSSTSAYYVEFPEMARGAARWLLGEYRQNKRLP